MSTLGITFGISYMLLLFSTTNLESKNVHKHFTKKYYKVLKCIFSYGK